MNRGDHIADFALPDQSGGVRHLSEFLANGPVVLFFYPAAMTYGCTKESCHFRDLKAEFEAVGAQRVGISADPVDKQLQFADKHDFDFPLLSDVDRTVAESFGVKRRSNLLRVKRSTFVIDTDSTLIEEIHSEVSMHSHADKALEILKTRTSRA
ncbi:MAG TPA: peroxiredoxin [Acidimicrobiia bacterium]|jgi:peroxiredoxin Q/BCP